MPMVNFFYYPIGRTGKFGIGIKSLSGESLSLSQARFPEIDFTTHTGALPVRSSRYMRKGTEKGARDKVRELNMLPDVDAINLIWHLNIVPVEKDYVISKHRYFQLHRKFQKKEFMQFTTQDKEQAAKVHETYVDRGVDSKLKSSVARSFKYTKGQHEYMQSVGEQVFTNSVQAPKEMRKKTKHRRTTSVRFWKGK